MGDALDTTNDLFDRLRARYSGNDGTILLEGVGNGAGFRNSGWSDAIAMQTWPSKGLRLIGFEVKATRSDWLRELDKPQKNEEWQSQCHEWYVVAPKDIVKLEELPSSWGLLVPKGKTGLRIASRSEREIEGKTVPLGLVAAVFRAAETSRREAVRPETERVRRETAEGFEYELKKHRKAAQDAADKYDQLIRSIGGRTFEDPESVVAKVAAMSSLKIDWMLGRMSKLGAELRDAAEVIDRHYAKLTESSKVAIPEEE